MLILFFKIFIIYIICIDIGIFDRDNTLKLLFINNALYLACCTIDYLMKYIL